MFRQKCYFISNQRSLPNTAVLSKFIDILFNGEKIAHQLPRDWPLAIHFPIANGTKPIDHKGHAVRKELGISFCIFKNEYENIIWRINLS